MKVEERVDQIPPPLYESGALEMMAGM